MRFYMWKESLYKSRGVWEYFSQEVCTEEEQKKYGVIAGVHNMAKATERQAWGLAVFHKLEFCDVLLWLEISADSS